MVNVYTASGDGQVHGEADSSRDQQHEARSSMKVDAQDHKDQAGVQAAAADRDASTGSARNAARDRLLPVDPGRTRSPCKRAAAAAPAPAGASTAPDQGAVAAVGLRELPDAAAVAPFPQQQQQQQQQQQALQDSSTSSISPSQQRPRGWQAMLPSPTQDDQETSNVFASDARELPASPVSSILQQQQVPLSLPSLHSAGTAAASTGTTAAAAAVQQPSSSTSSSTGVRAPRPTPLLVGCDTPPPSSSSRFSLGHASGSQQQQPGSASHTTASRPPSGLQNRPAALQIQPPVSPLGVGCLTPSGLLSPGAMARPYSGPNVLLEDLDLEAIDGTDGVSVDGGTGGSNSSSSSPVHAIYRSGGLRSSRDHGDLRRTALMNQMLSPRPNISATNSGPVSLFTGETRALRVTPLPGSGGSTPSGATATGGEGDAAGSQATPSFTSTEQHLQQLLTSSVRNIRGTSPSSGASPSAAGSICNGSSSGGSILDRPTRSLPGTPAASRYNVAAAMAAAAGSSSTASCALAPSSSSRSSSMTASPVVPPPSHGAAAALLAGSVVASPRTPRSPLSVIFSPRFGGSVSAPLHSSTSTPTALPPPLFGPGVSLVPTGSGAVSSPAASADLSISAALQQQPGSARASFMSPAGSRLSAASPSPTLGMAAALAAPQQQQQQVYAEQQQQQSVDAQVFATGDSELAAASAAGISLDGAAASVPQQPLPRRASQQPQPEHLQQLLQRQLQLHDTRLGPHGESPLSPSHHSALIQQQHRGEGGLRSSPTRPTPLVPPALAAAAAAAHAVRRAGAAADAAAAADEAAAAACEVEDVGQLSDVHEWLDQHSWPFSYELPMHLRDAAEFARGSSSSSGNGNAGHGLVSILAPHNAVSVTAAGPFGGGPSPGSSNSSGRGGGADRIRYGNAAASERHMAHAAGSWEQQRLAGRDEQVVQLEQLGDLTARLERFRVGAATERAAQAAQASTVPEVAGCDDSRGDSCAEVQGGGVANAVVAAAAGSSAAVLDHQDCAALPQHSSSIGCTAAAGSGSCGVAAAAASGGSFRVLANSRAGASVAVPALAAGVCDHLTPGLNTAGQGPGAAASAALSSGSTPAVQQQQQQQQTGNAGTVADNSYSRGSRAGSSSSSNVRLLSPGSHRYTAGSQVAADCCCCTCAPTSPNAAAATAAGVRSEGCGASDGGSSGGAAADKRWSDAAMAVEDAGVQLSPARSWQQHLHDGSTPAAALQLQGQQRARQVVVQLQQQHANVNAATASCAGGVQEEEVPYRAQGPAAGPPRTGCFDRGRASSVTADTLPAAPLAQADGKYTAEDGWCDQDQDCLAGEAKAASVQSLMCDGVYVRRLLASLPGVDPRSPHVRLAVLELQGTCYDDS